MNKLLSRFCVIATAVVVATGGLAATAQAYEVEAGTLTFTGDPGDWVTGGDSHAYDVAAGDDFRVDNVDNALIKLMVFDPDDDVYWSMDLHTPRGETFTSGTTYTATRYPADDGAGFDFSGDGRACGPLSATVTVHEAVFGAYGYIETFHASFEQRCDGFAAAARGEVRIDNQPAATPQALEAAVESGTVTATGDADLTGTVTCAVPAEVFVYGRLFQLNGGSGDFRLYVDCTPGAPVPWSVTATPWSSAGYHAGSVELDLYASAYDEFYFQTAEFRSTTQIVLT